MVGIVLVSHSRQLADGAAEMVASIARGACVRAAGGDPDGGLGTSPDVGGPGLGLALIGALTSELEVTQGADDRGSRFAMTFAPAAIEAA